MFFRLLIAFSAPDGATLIADQARPIRRKDTHTRAP